ncbi:MAG: phage portal protein [bacterium]|nr:phage portal protein [bacterium]
MGLTNWIRRFFGIRNYDAGSYERTNRNWVAVNDSGEATDKNYRARVKARSRDLERNTDIMNAFIHPWLRNVAGQGFTLEAKTGNDVLDEQLERLWEKWTKKDNCDVTGTQSLWEMLRMAVRRKRVDGGILFVKCYTPRGILPFKLQVLETDELDDNAFIPHFKGNRVVGGVEYDSYNYAVGYHIREYDIQGYQIPQSHFVERERVIFYFSKTRPTQIREMPEMAAGIPRMKEVNGYIEATTIKERMAACFGLVIKKTQPSGTLGRAAVNGERKTNYRELELTPGMVTQLNDGDDLQVVNPGTSAANSAEYLKTLQRLIASGQGISYESASRDLSSANYSSARQATIEDEETFAWDTQKLVDEILDEVYASFVEAAVLSGEINIPDYFTNQDKYIEHEWNRKPKRWIDPMKEANSNKIALETGQKTLADIWRDGGRDYRTVLNEMKEILDYAQEIGLRVNMPWIVPAEESVEKSEEETVQEDDVKDENE